MNTFSTFKQSEIWYELVKGHTGSFKAFCSFIPFLKTPTVDHGDMGPNFLVVGNICKVTNILPHLSLTVFGTPGFCLRPPRFAFLCEMQSWKYVLCVKGMRNGPLLSELVFLECNFYLTFPTQFSNLEIWVSFCATCLTQSM